VISSQSMCSNLEFAISLVLVVPETSTFQLLAVEFPRYESSRATLSSKLLGRKGLVAVCQDENWLLRCTITLCRVVNTVGGPV
jgi:hypothetical protein